LTMTDEEYFKEIYNPTHKDFPELLSEEESDRLDNFRTFVDAKDNRAAALEFAKKVRGIVYTQIDTDSPPPDEHTPAPIAYDRGLHLVNRTGVYAVVWKPLCRMCHHTKNAPREQHPSCNCSCHR